MVSFAPTAYDDVVEVADGWLGGAVYSLLGVAERWRRRIFLLCWINYHRQLLSGRRRQRISFKVHSQTLRTGERKTAERKIDDIIVEKLREDTVTQSINQCKNSMSFSIKKHNKVLFRVANRRNRREKWRFAWMRGRWRRKERKNSFMRVFELIFYCLSTIETLSYDAGRLIVRERGEKAANRRVD